MDTEFYEREDHPVWCSQCERWDEDCVCEELCDHFRESVGSTGDGDVCVPALSPVPLQTISPDREPASSDSAKAESNKQPVPSCSGTGTLLLDYPAWRMSFSAYGEHMGWEVPA